MAGTLGSALLLTRCVMQSKSLLLWVPTSWSIMGRRGDLQGPDQSGSPGAREVFAAPAGLSLSHPSSVELLCVCRPLSWGLALEQGRGYLDKAGDLILPWSV